MFNDNPQPVIQNYLVEARIKHWLEDIDREFGSFVGALISEYSELEGDCE